MNASVVDFKPSLRSAQQAFDQWRSHRTQRGVSAGVKARLSAADLCKAGGGRMATLLHLSD